MPYSGMLLRPAQPEDALPIARVHVRSWQIAYRGLLPDEYLDGLRPENRAKTYDFTHIDPLKPRTIVAADGTEIFGFATTMPSRDADLADHGELCALYVDPDRWGCGIGRELIAAARGQLLEAGLLKALLWVLDGNVRATRFYEADGWFTDGYRRTETMLGVTVNDIRYLRVL